MTKIEYLLTLEASKFSSALAGVSGAVGKSTSFIERHLGALAAIGGVSVSVGGMVAGLKNAFDMGDSLNKFSAMTGQTIRNSAVLKQAFKGIGMDVEEAAGIFAIMQRSLAGTNEAGQPTKDIFEKLGLDVAKLKTASGPEQLKAITAALAKLPEGAIRAQAAMEIFGRSGTRMLEMVKTPGLISGKLSASAELLAKNAETFEQVSKSLEKAGAVLKTFFVGAAAGLAPVLQPILDKITSLDFSSWGLKAGTALNAAIGAFKAGELSSLLGAGFEVAALKLQGPLLSAVNIAVAGFSAGIVAAAVEAGKLLKAAIEGVGSKAMALAHGEFIEGGARNLETNKAEYGKRVAAGDELADVVKFRNVLGLKTGGTEEAEAALKAAVGQVGSYREFLSKRQPGAQEATQANAEAYISSVTGKMQELSYQQFSKVQVDPATIAKEAAASIGNVVAAAFKAAELAPTALGANASKITAAEGRYNEKLAKYQSRPKEGGDTGGEAQAAGGQTASEKTRKPEVDSLTRVGLFVANTSNAVATDFLRRTTENTQKANEIASSVLDAIKKLSDRGITVNLQEGYA
ncbi:MAG: hypothetical protein PHI35_00620 [Victivallaceae bacterium]|nr:hypothetical protein [Victivallaceae bacterium]